MLTGRLFRFFCRSMEKPPTRSQSLWQTWAGRKTAVRAAEGVGVPPFAKSGEGWDGSSCPYNSGFHTKTSKLVTPKDKSWHARDHGVAG